MKSVKLAARLLADGALFLDTETTGMGPGDQVVEIAVVASDGALLLNTLVKPTAPISPGALAVHGIRECDVAGAPSFAELLPRLHSIVGNRPIVFYNAPFDQRIIAQTALSCNLKAGFCDHAHCAMEMYAEFAGDWNNSRGSYRWHKLEVAARRCGIETSTALHRAAADAELTRQIVMFMARSLLL